MKQREGMTEQLIRMGSSEGRTERAQTPFAGTDPARLGAIQRRDEAPADRRPPIVVGALNDLLEMNEQIVQY